MNSIKIFSPATLSNIGPGYDIFGMALQAIGDTIELSWREDKHIEIAPIAGFPDIPLEANKNIAGLVASLMLKEQGIDKGLNIHISKNVMPGSGLGSSGSSAAGTAFGLNELMGKPYSQLEVIDFAMQGEAFLAGKAHADNVAPAVMGGFTLVTGYQPLHILKLPPLKNLHIAVVHPQVEVKTVEARKLLPHDISLETHTRQGGQIAGLVAGMATGNLHWIKECMRDLIAEPARKKLIPAYEQAKELALVKGAIGCSISGSGPSIFAFADSEEVANSITEGWQQLYEQQQIDCKCYTSGMNDKGCEVL